MMGNSSIVYHIESILEMQFLCLITIFYLRKFEGGSVQGDGFQNQEDLIILCSLVFEHVFSYGCSIFRTYDIKRNGQMDVNGIYRAKTETFLGNVEVFIDCIIMGYTLNHLMSAEKEHLMERPYTVFWIIIDCTLMFLTLGYVYLSQIMKVKVEIQKNIYSLFFLQLERIKEIK